MGGYRITIDDAPKSEDMQALSAGLTEHALPWTGAPGFRPVAVFLRDDAGGLAGGVWGYINWNWLQIGLVWLSEELRGDGYGRRRIGEMERLGRERGCRYAHLDTFSYQARPFYERLGYEVFTELDDYPAGHRRYFMKKVLD